jgi:hypothetical protein
VYLLASQECVCVFVCVCISCFLLRTTLGLGRDMKRNQAYFCLSGDFIVCAQYCLPLWVGSMLVGLQELGVGD